MTSRANIRLLNPQAVIAMQRERRIVKPIVRHTLRNVVLFIAAVVIAGVSINALF